MSTEARRPWGIHTIGDMIAPKSIAAGMPDGRYVRAVRLRGHDQ
jgi:hypothetical protein